MMTLLEIIRRSENFLFQRSIHSARREAEEVIADALGMKRIDLYLQFDRPFTESELIPIRSAILRRGKHEPAPYIARQVSFAGVDIQVNPTVLIPRPETEILVEKISEYFYQQDLKGKVLWDLCCGSGCIGLSLKKRFPDLTVILSDIDGAALKTAQANAAQNNLDVMFKQGDLFLPFEDECCDYLVCNPPYISEAEFSQLPPEVSQWEPKVALIGGPTGLEYYERIASKLSSYLQSQGKAWLEIGAGQGKSVRHLFEKQGFSCEISQDWAGHDRFCDIRGRDN